MTKFKNCLVIILPLTVLTTLTDTPINLTRQNIIQGVGDTFGTDLAIGDVNNDRIDDLVVSTPDRGIVSILLGTLQGAINPAPNMELQVIPQGNPNTPQPILLVDVSGDGWLDLIVGQPQGGLGLATDAGHVIVFHNTRGTQGLPFFTDGQSSRLRPNSGQSQQGGRFGWSITSGDFNGDSRMDLLIGEPRVDFAFIGPGLANFFFGPLATGTYSSDMFIQGDQNEDLFGYSVAAGNIIGDARDDAVIGSPSFDISKSVDRGRVQIFGGEPGGISRTSTIEFRSPNTADIRFGALVSVGDLDNIGLDDVIICNPQRVYIFMNPANSTSTNPDIIINMIETHTLMRSTQLFIGDINLDNKDDVVIGSPHSDRAHLFVDLKPHADQIIETPADRGAFGTAIIAGNVQNSDEIELIIGMPRTFGPGEVYFYSEMADGTDDQASTIVLNGKEWTAQNADVDVPGSKAHPTNPNFGRFYTLQGAKNVCSALGSGWRLPMDEEWQELAMAFGGYYNWLSPRTPIGNPSAGLKALIQGGSSGFNASRAGKLLTNGSSYKIGKEGYYWSNTMRNSANAVTYQFTNGRLYRTAGEIDSWQSCRCVKD